MISDSLERETATVRGSGIAGTDAARAPAPRNPLGTQGLKTLAGVD
jgi:hypothetical protein